MVGLDATEIATGIETFPGLAHRQQLAAIIDGIRYINDSKATNTDAASHALAAIKQFIGLQAALPRRWAQHPE